MNLRLIQSGIPVTGIHWALQQHTELWNQNTARTQNPDSPHHGLDDLWVRYGAPDQDPSKPHDSHWHAPADVLGLKPICLDIMRLVGGSIMGGVLITRIPPGATCKPHHDRGWHADVHDKYALQITSAPGQKFCFDDIEIETAPGDLFWFENQSTHWVLNPTNYERITMIACIK